MKKTKVVIIGGGFAGVEAAKKLVKHSEVEITLIDQNNYHLFQPLLYQVATAGLSAGEICFPIRSMFAGHKNFTFVMDKVESVDLHSKLVCTQEQKVSYDYLIVGMGAKTSYFGHDEWKEFSYSLKSVDDALIMRNRLLKLFEEKEIRSNNDININIIGGGPTGVELAGSIAEFINFTTKNEFRFIDPKQTKLRLIERGERLLSSFSPKSSQKVKGHLESLGVKVMLEAEISQIESNCIHLKKDGRLLSDLTIWGAGVEPLRLPAYLPMGDEKGVLCDPDLSLSKDKRVFIIGDQSHIEGRNLPSLAPVAIQQGATAAKNILADLSGRPRKVFDYKNRGALAVVGRKYAVAQIFGAEFTGFFAWCIWCFVHILPLINFRSKFFVFCEFAWAYFNYSRGVRIITRQTTRD